MMRVELAGTPSSTGNRWLQDYSDRSVLLPNGVTMDPAQFGAVDANGRLWVRSGTLIGKTDAEQLFGPATATDDEIYFLWKDSDIKSDPLVEAVRRGTIYIGLLPTATQTLLDAAMRTELRTRNFQLVNYTGAGIDE